MKRIGLILMTLACVVSCLDDPGFVQSNTIYADFEYGYVNEDFKKDSLYYEQPFASNNALVFMNKTDKATGTFLGGFALSNFSGNIVEKKADDEESQADEPKETNPFRVYAPQGTKNSYAVFHQSSQMPEHDVAFNIQEIGTCRMRMCFVNNTAQVVEYVKENFEVGDRITLKAVGYLDGKQVATKDIFLADYSAQKDSVVTRWTQMDLSSFGFIDYVDFEISSTKPDVPMYFCLDAMVADVTVSY